MVMGIILNSISEKCYKVVEILVQLPSFHISFIVIEHCIQDSLR